jgi:hypothetical protein
MLQPSAFSGKTHLAMIDVDEEFLYLLLVSVIDYSIEHFKTSQHKVRQALNSLIPLPFIKIPMSL